MVVADVLVPIWHQGISNRHADFGPFLDISVLEWQPTMT